MKIQRPDIPKKYQPRGFEILHEDPDLLVGIKSAGVITVDAAWDRERTSVQNVLTDYLRKGMARSTKEAYVVHRLDQATSGLLVFAKSERVQEYLKSNWKTTTKTYFTIVHGHLKEKSGLIESYLSEDEEYLVRSSDDMLEGRLARTEYEVVRESNGGSNGYSLVKINLLTGRKNQIRVHMSDLGHPVVGDRKYGADVFVGSGAATVGGAIVHAGASSGGVKGAFGKGPAPRLSGKGRDARAGGSHRDPRANNKASKFILEIALHAQALEFTHPHSRDRYRFEAPLPALFQRLMP